MLSDNGTNFTFVQPLVGQKVKITDPRVDNFLSSNRIEWHFIPAFSPWYGGSYERMNGIVKSCLCKALGTKLVDFVTLQTALYRVANIVNNRPLTYVPADELYKPLTPNHFLKLGETNVDTSLEITVEQLPSTTLNLFEGYRHMLRLVRNFTEAFHSHYFAYLKERLAHTHRHPRGSIQVVPNTGDVVLIQELTAPQGTWPIGIITSADKRGGKAWVRSQETISALHLPGGRQTQYVNKEYTINRLYPLELAANPPGQLL